MRPTELVAVQRIRARRERLDASIGPLEHPRLLGASLASFAPGGNDRPQVYVSLIDNEICGYIVAERDDRHYRWNLRNVGAGSERLEATEDACIELWSALLEYAVVRAGESGARRLFAGVEEGSMAHAGLCNVAFVPYCRMLVLSGGRRGAQVAEPAGFREQHASDVWSIHQLYHRATPRPVQFAEALTSDEWSIPRRRDRLPVVGDGYRQYGYVLEADDSVTAFVRITRRRTVAFVSLLVQPDTEQPVADLVASALRRAGVSRREAVVVGVADYLQECVGPLEQLGLAIDEERLLMVKHTTAAAVVHPRLVPLPSVSRRERRAARRAPSLMCGQVAHARNWYGSGFGAMESERGLV